MTKEEAKKYLMDIFYQLGTMSIEYLSEKDGEKMREAIKALEQEPCTDAISRQAVLDEIYNTDGISNIYFRLADKITALPPVTPAEKVGQWIDNSDRIDTRFGKHTYKCSECGKYAEYFVSGTEVWWDRIKPNYCPNCGAKMQEVEE